MESKIKALLKEIKKADRYRLDKCYNIYLLVRNRYGPLKLFHAQWFQFSFSLILLILTPFMVERCSIFVWHDNMHNLSKQKLVLLLSVAWGLCYIQLKGASSAVNRDVEKTLWGESRVDQSLVGDLKRMFYAFFVHRDGRNIREHNWESLALGHATEHPFKVYSCM